MRRIWPQAAEVDLADTYLWPAGPWVRAVMLTTLDGAVAGPGGVSRSVTGPPDQAVFSHIRTRADAILVGAATILAERYNPLRARGDFADVRVAAGQAPAPVLVIVSARLTLDFSDPLFTDSTVTPIVVTTQHADQVLLARAENVADVIVLPGPRVAPRALFTRLGERGLHHVNCEGGPLLLRSLIDGDALDEFDLTVAPVAAGGAGRWPRNPAQGSVGVSVPRWMELREVLELGGFLFTRYQRATPSGGGDADGWVV